VKERNDYYAFGARHVRADYPQTDNRLKYNAKESQTTGSLPYLDFGARKYDPRIGRWFNIDPLAEIYSPISPYTYCLNTPINAIDPDGRLVIFINGMHFGDGGKTAYWAGFDNAVMRHLSDFNSMYYDGSVGGLLGLYAGKSFRLGITYSNLDPQFRHDAGYAAGKKDFASILSQLGEDETIKIITHSMGATYAKGFIQALLDMGLDPSRIAFEADFAPFQTRLQIAHPDVYTLQFSHDKDWVAGNDRMWGAIFMDTSGDKDQGHSISSFLDQIQSLPQGRYRFVNGQLVPY